MRPTPAYGMGILGKGVFLVLVCLTGVACQGPDVSPHIYGVWQEPIEGGGVELREDGTAIWYGQQGTFEVEVERVGRMTCGLSVVGCYYGDITIRVGDQVIETGYYDRLMTADTQGWTMTFGAPVRTPSGRAMDALRMRRADANDGPQTWPGFERMDAGFTNYYTADGQFHRVAGRFVRDRAEPYAVGPELHVWDADAARWTRTVDAQADNRFVFGETLLYNQAGAYSVDGGLTFVDAPALSDIPADRDLAGAVVLGQEVIVLTRTNVDDGDLGNEVWALDLSADAPIWNRRHHLVEGNYSAQLHVAPIADALIISWLNDAGPLRSLDGGRTWAQIDTEGNTCQDGFLVNDHPAGCWCTNEAQRSIYDAREDTWVTFDLGGWNERVVVPTNATLAATYPLFIVENDTLVFIDWAGQRVPTVALPAGVEPYRLMVYRDFLLYPDHALWARVVDL